MNKDTVVRVRMSSELVKKIDELAEKTDRNRSNLVRLAIKEYLKGETNLKVADVQEKVKNIVSFIFRETSDRYYAKQHSLEPELIVDSINNNGFNFYKKTDGFDDKLNNSYEISGNFNANNEGVTLYFRFYKKQKLHEYQVIFRLDDSNVLCELSRRHSDSSISAEYESLTYTE